LETIYLALFERLWRFAYLTVGQQDVAEEVAQDVFFALWQRRAAIDVHGDIAVYLHSAVRYRAVKHVRHDRVVHRYAEGAESAGDELPHVARIEGPEETLSAIELERAFLDALAAVPDRARQALVLRWRDGWTYEEVGEALGISKVAARALVLRYQRRLEPFLNRLRRELEG
jgi:RNA polymerase sigma-70 factor (ECF subfamily)